MLCLSIDSKLFIESFPGAFDSNDFFRPAHPKLGQGAIFIRQLLSNALYVTSFSAHVKSHYVHEKPRE